MAGSFRHVVDGKGNFRGTELLDDFGDAYEALEEMYAMIQQLTGGDKQKIYDAWFEGYAKKCIPPENLTLPWVGSADGFWKKHDE